MVKETEKFDRERRIWSTCFAHFWLFPEGDIGCLLALAGRYNAPTGFCHTVWDHCGTAEQGSLLAARRACHSFTQAHRTVSKAQQKTCSLREQRTRAPSILTLSWRIPDEPPRWKVVVESREDTGILGPPRRRIQSRARDEAWCSELLCNKVLLKYKGDRESFWHRHQKGAERISAKDHTRSHWAQSLPEIWML